MASETNSPAAAADKKLRGVLRLRAVAPDDAGFVAALSEAGLVTDDLAGAAAANFAFARKGGAPVAYGGYTVLGDIALLRSLVVLPQWRGQRVGGRLATALISQLQGINIRTVYLLTEDAELFFATLGFRAIDRAAAPQAVRESSQFLRHCPEEAIVMERALDEMMQLKLDEIHINTGPR